MPKLTRGQVAGFAALGLLVVLIGAAVYSSRLSHAPANSAATQPDAAAATPAPDVPAADAPTDRHVAEPAPAKSHDGATITAVAEDVMLTPKARLLAERLMCVCGCNDILATCTCAETPGSRDMKKYLQQLVDEGKTPSEIEGAMVARYGPAVRP